MNSNIELQIKIFFNDLADIAQCLEKIKNSEISDETRKIYISAIKIHLLSLNKLQNQILYISCDDGDCFVGEYIKKMLDWIQILSKDYNCLLDTLLNE